ncbi:hypothetical protein K3495_g10121 [Podosphaera aphanis]|nr:hypothetical protein K3495_g10121 [Podosphaera aphanis]
MISKQYPPQSSSQYRLCDNHHYHIFIYFDLESSILISSIIHRFFVRKIRDGSISNTPFHALIQTFKQRLIKALHDAGINQSKIAAQLNISRKQVGYSLRRRSVTPKKARGRSPSLSSEDVDKIEEFIKESPENRQMTYFELANGPFKHLGVSERVIKSELEKRGFKRYTALNKPTTSPEIRRKRREWAKARIDWTLEQWMSILWSDETWATDGHHSRRQVSRKPGEEHEINCIVETIKKKIGWMFWASFAGSEKGPSQFWEKGWGNITSSSYSERIVPLLDGMTRFRPGLYVMQDNAPPHVAARTMEEFQERSITPIDWPPYSPDPNSTEHVWKIMKDKIEYKYPDLNGGKRRSSDQIRAIVKEAWDSVSTQELTDLIESMHDRCQAVIDADGGPTKY